MKVLFVGTIPISGPGVSPDTMEAHIIEAFQQLSVDCHYFPILTHPLGGRLNRLFESAKTDYRLIRHTPAQRSLFARAKAFQPDIILVLLGNYTTPDTMKALRRQTGATTVCWCQDHMGTMGRQYIIGSDYDFVFTKDQTMVDLFQRYTHLQEVHYLAEACNPLVHKPLAPTPEDLDRFGCEVTTAASLYYFRAEILESLSDFDLRIWGTLPRYYDGSLRERHMGQAVFMRDKAACFNSARIVVNTLHPMESGGLNARAFEVAGCGGFQLITHSDAVRRHFEPGKEIETFVDLKELREKVGYYIAHEEERRAIAEAGRRRAHAEHSYTRRLQRLLSIVSQPSHLDYAPAAST